MELLVERIFAIFIAISGPILTIFDLPGNTLLLLTSLMSAMVLIYALGEFWEFCVGLFGIKRSKVSWFAVIFIALGSFAGTLLGTLIFPILGSLLGGMAGAFAAAFAYELAHTGVSAAAMQLAWTAAKMRFFAMLGKLAAGIALAALLLKQVVFF